MKEMPMVLVVDDDPHMVKTLCGILTLKGYPTETAFSGVEAIEKVQAGGVGCVLMDVKMPGLDGVAALKLIHRAAQELPVVLMSAYVSDVQIDEARQSGACGVLTKPVDIQQVLSFLSLLQKEENILIVADDPAFCRPLKEILETRGYCVTTAIDPDQAVACLEPHYQLVVILDDRLGEGDGIDMLKRIQTKYPSKPVVLATGYRGEVAGTVVQGLKIGACTCVDKLLAIEELLRIVDEISRQKRVAVFEHPFS